MGEALEKLRRAVLAAKRQMAIDDELFRFILYDLCDVDAPEKASLKGLRCVLAALDGLGRRSGHIVKPSEKYNIRLMAIDDLHRELRRLGLGIQGTANALSKSLFGVDSYKWCRMDQIGQMVSVLRKRAREKAS